MKRTLLTSTLIAAGLIAGTYVAPTNAGPGRGECQMGIMDVGFAGPGGPGGPGEFEGRRGGDRPGGPGGPGMGPGMGAGPLADAARILMPFWENESVVEDLGLTEEQVAALAESLEITKAALEETEGSIREAHEALREEMDKDAPDLETASDLLDAVTAAVNEKGQIILSHAVLVKNVLTAEQEELLPRAVRDAARDLRDTTEDLREEVRQAIADGATLEEVYAIIDSYDLPEPIAEKAKEKAARWFENHQDDDTDVDTSRTRSKVRSGAQMKNTDATIGWRARK